jgi:hypothetical protein
MFVKYVYTDICNTADDADNGRNIDKTESFDNARNVYYEDSAESYQKDFKGFASNCYNFRTKLLKKHADSDGVENIQYSASHC